jgi:hypothetical protein
MALSRVQTQHKLPAFPTKMAMPNPFSGMNPYLESPELWRSVHNRLIVAIADLYLFNLPDIIPAFALPLRAGDAEPIGDLQGLLNGVYDRAAYDLRIDYTAALLAALSETDAAWRMFCWGRKDRSHDRRRFKGDRPQMLQDVS